MTEFSRGRKPQGMMAANRPEPCCLRFAVPQKPQSCRECSFSWPNLRATLDCTSLPFTESVKTSQPQPSPPGHLRRTAGALPHSTAAGRQTCHCVGKNLGDEAGGPPLSACNTPLTAPHWPAGQLRCRGPWQHYGASVRAACSSSPARRRTYL